MMQKILHVAEVSKGGVISVMDLLVKSQADSGDFQQVIRLCPEDAPRVEHSGVHHLHFRRTGRNLASHIRLIYAFTYAVWKEQPAIVHLHSTFAGLWCRLAAALIRPFRPTVIVYTPHAFSFLSHTRFAGIYTLAERLLSSLCDAVICVSRYEFDAAVKGGLAVEKLRMIYNGVQDQGEPSKAQDELTRVLFVGRFDRQKGFDILIDALQSLENKPRLRIHAVGAADREDSNITIPQTIKLLGWLDPRALAEEYIWADVVVVPSRWEGFAMVPLEAMSFSCAVIASNIPPLAEAVADGSGILFAPGDASALQAIFVSHSAEEFRQMGRSGAFRQRELFSFEAMTSATLKAYAEVSAKPKSKSSGTTPQA
ncbi:Glycosyltransferase [Polaromonas sp. CG9_12]|nr:Glycosyltransferase [Polaromonas sp. CG9_12]